MGYPSYTEEEDQIILDNLIDLAGAAHRVILKRCYYISEQYLPHRSAEAIQMRYKKLGKPQFIPIEQWFEKYGTSENTRRVTLSHFPGNKNYHD